MTRRPLIVESEDTIRQKPLFVVYSLPLDGEDDGKGVTYDVRTLVSGGADGDRAWSRLVVPCANREIVWFKPPI